MSLPTNVAEAQNNLDLITRRLYTENNRNYNLGELKQIAHNLRLPSDGNRERLVNRIRDYINEYYQEEAEVIVQDTFPKASYEALLKQLYNL